MFCLYSDMTIKPNEKQFQGFNNAFYYINHDFAMLYEFEDREGYTVELRRPVKCLELLKPAVVSNSQNGYVLKEKGVLIVEER